MPALETIPTTSGDGAAIDPAAHEIAPGQLFIGGAWRDASDGQTRPTISPIDESEITQIAQATETDIEDAVRSARRALEEGPWATMSVHDRGRILFRVAELVEANIEELAWRETIDMGKPIAFSRVIDAPITAQLFWYFGGMASKIDGATRSADTATLNYTLRKPVGVVAAITPFNYPLVLSCTKFAPALAAGNTVIHKPASATPLAAIKMAEIFAEAGLPDGVFNLLTGPGSRVGDALVKHPGVDKIAFTGSTPVGQGIIREGAATLKHVTMELGGKSANIVFADADLDNAVEQAYLGIFYNKGEQCTAGSRLLVERSVHDEVVEALVARAEAAVIGDPRDPTVNFGPLADADQFNKVSEYVRIGREDDGATLRTGGQPRRVDSVDGKGFFYEPTIFIGAKNTMRISQEEIFGPVLAVIPFDTEDEAIRLANDTPFGLASGVQTNNLKRAHRVAAAMQAGTCWINTYNQFDSTTPFGGFKASGYGRELGPETLEAYTQTMSIWVDLS